MARARKSGSRKSGRKSGSRKSGRKSGSKKLNAYTRFVKANISRMTGTSQKTKMRKVAALWRKTKKSGSRKSGRKSGRRSGRK